MKAGLAAVMLWGLLCAFSGTVPAGAGQRVALVIGNSNYTAVGKLANPQSDADLIAKSLRQAGFLVDKKLNVGKQAMDAALQAFSAKADDADVAFIYYAGHGMEAGGENYLIPVDARLRNDRDLAVEATKLDTVLDFVSNARLRMVVLDACRDNPFAETMKRSLATRSTSRRGGLAAIKEQPHTFVAYAAAAGAVAEDGIGANSPYAEALAARILEPGIEIDKVFRRVHDDVQRKTDERQHPYVYYMRSGEDVFFVPPKQGSVVAQQGAGQSVQGELEFWRSTERIDNAAAYRAYLRKYPRGDYADLAAAQLEKLDRKVAQTKPQAAEQHDEHQQHNASTGSEAGKSKAGDGIAALADLVIAMRSAKNQAPAHEHGTQPPAQAPQVPIEPNIAGTWQGTYVCAQGQTGAQLFIEQWTDGSLRARFDFGGVGAYALTGRITGGRIYLNAQQWIVRPQGFDMAGIEGMVSPDLVTITGRLVYPQCTALMVRRVAR